MAAQLNVARQVAESFVGRTLMVLVEKEVNAKELRAAQVSSWEHGMVRGMDHHRSQLRGQYAVARGQADAPDIDGRIYVRGALPIGEFAQVRIIGHTDYDLIAEAV
jgi:ribosomal protein S12 methylthiotransferase